MPDSAVANAPRETNGRQGGRTNQIRRKTSLPTGRAVVGALLMTLAALGVFLAYTNANEDPTDTYAVVTRDLDAGALLGIDDVRLETMELPSAVSSGAFEDVDDLVGRRLLAPLLGGDLVQASAVSDSSGAAEAVYQISFAVERAASVNGLVRRGDLVDVYVTYDDRTNLVVRRVEVLQAPGTADERFGANDDSVVVVQLSSSDEVMRVVHAMQTGEMTIVRSTFADPADRGPELFQPDRATPSTDEAD